MTSKFLGKWRLYLSKPKVPNFASGGYAAYTPEPHSQKNVPVGLFCMWYVNNPAGGPYPPGKETNIAFIASDQSEPGELRILLNNGQYVTAREENRLGFTSELEDAVYFSFITPELPPESFTGRMIMIGTDAFTWIGDDPNGRGFLVSGLSVNEGPMFEVSQVTPTLESFIEGGKGDGLDFAWVDLTGAVLKGVSCLYADFSNCNLTDATFTAVDFSGADLTNAHLTRAKLQNVFLIHADFSNCNLTEATFTNVYLTDAILDNADLTGAKGLNAVRLHGATFKGTILSQTSLAGAVFKQADLTSVIADPPPQFYNTPLQPPSPTNPRTSLAGCKLKQSLIANDWSMLDLTGATISDLSSPLSSAAKPLIAKYAILSGLNNNNLVGLTLQNAVFDYAVLDGLGLNSSDQNTSDLTSASFIQASMHGTNLTGAILKGAKMTGAQLGSLSHLSTLPAGYETHLNAGPTVDAALRDQFAQHGITLSATATLSTLAPGRVWQLNDAGNKIIYTVRMEDKSDDVQVLTVYAPASAASLVNAYMPDAVLTGANLYGVVASGAQFYGGKALVDSFAILEEVEFNDANLSNVNFTQANLYGANLSGAHLFNAKFNHAHLSPSANGVATNLSNANLQGADFTDATLDGANLANAAVAINVPTKANPKQGGVYVFSLPYKGDTTTLAQYTTELDAATTGFTLPYNGDTTTLAQYLAALKSNNLAPLKIAFLKHQPPIVLSANAQIKVIEVDSIWQIVDGTQSYTLWTDPDESGTTKLYVAPSLTNTQAGFQKRNMTLRWQASATADTPGQQWLLDNDSENPNNFSTGYVRFIVKLNGNVLDVYGTAVHIERLGDKQQLQMDTETCNETVLSVSNMSSQTICPNESTLGVNQQGGKTWDPLWLRARTPPEPPTCVPTDYQWCPPQKTKQKEIGSHSQRTSEPIDRDRR